MLEPSAVTRWIVASLIAMVGAGLGGVGTAHAQPMDVSLTSQQPPTRIALQPAFQRYDEGEDAISEWSMPLVAFVPLRDNMLLGVRTGLARAAGDQFTSVAGRGDLQATLSYTQDAGAGSIIANLGVNLPSGTTALTAEEFETVTQLSQNFYPFRMPGFGQGVNLTPGVTWAVPAGERVMLGLGVSYQFRGGFTPVDGMEDPYDPGNEMRLTGGADVRVGAGQALSGDLTVTLYGTDAIGGVEQYGPGSKVSATAQYMHTLGFNTVRVVARYQSQAKSSLPATTDPGASSDAVRVIPTEGMARVVYRYRVQEGIDITWHAEGRLFGETDTFSSKSLFTTGFAPAFAVSDQWTLQPQFAYTLGSFSGIEAGVGMSVEL